MRILTLFSFQRTCGALGFPPLGSARPSPD
jgi:hypothetical protein